MRPLTSFPWSWLMCVYLSLATVSSFESPNNRIKKHFSLFSVVQFNNEECTTDNTPSGGVTQGTCYTTTECTDKKGIKAGKCASGFGVCCAILNTAQATATIKENRTRLRNSLFPKNDASTANIAITYTINKMQTDICQIRLDFAKFVLAGPANTMENIVANANTHCTVDTFTITTTSVKNAPDTNTGTLCGSLTGEHLYVDVSPTAADTATLKLDGKVTTTNAATGDRIWDIKVSQIECHSTYRAPPGCDRYLMTSTGTITSLNFNLPSNVGQNLGIELASQRLNTCIRRSKGMCCVEYHVCASFAGIALGDTSQTSSSKNRGVGTTIAIAVAQIINEGWSLDTNTDPYVVDVSNQATVISTLSSSGTTAAVIVPANFGPQINIGMVDNMCSGDYVEIPSSWSGGCGSAHGSARNAINSRYCGARFGANFQAGLATSHSTPVCDCSEPFVVRHNSDTVNDVGGAGAGLGTVTSIATNNLANTVAARPRGFCLDYRQLPCWN